MMLHKISSLTTKQKLFTLAAQTVLSGFGNDSRSNHIKFLKFHILNQRNKISRLSLSTQGNTCEFKLFVFFFEFLSLRLPAFLLVIFIMFSISIGSYSDSFKYYC